MSKQVMTLTVAGLIAHLEKFPLAAPVFYRDENFGGRGEETSTQDFSIEEGEVYIRCPHWEDVNEGEYE